MSPEIDLLNTYPVCGHEPHADLHALPRPTDGRGSRLITAEPDTAPAAAIGGSALRRGETLHATHSDTVASE